VAATLAVFRRDLRATEATSGPLESDPDEPISKDDEDILDRIAVVDSLVRAVASDCVPVIGLVGAYGDGKTSVLNLLSTALENRGVLVVRFSTWLPLNEETLVSTLLNSILKALQAKLFIPEVKGRLIELTRTLCAVLPRVPHSVKDLFEKPSQSAQIAELTAILSRVPVRVAVLLDDMDRMHRGELDATLKLIRGVPNFPTMTYVCAFDPDALVQTLRPDTSATNQSEALRFLEKFFPDQIPLPKIEEALLTVEFEKRFFAICDRGNLLLGAQERQKFKDDFRTLWLLHLRKYFTNLRRVKLCANRLNRSLPTIGHEVNLREFVLLEVVRMINPLVYEEIFRNAPYFMFVGWRISTWLLTVHSNEKEEQARRQSYFDILFKDLPRPPDGILLGLLGELFPTVKAYLEGGAVPPSISEDAADAERRRSIIHPDFFPRYFIFHVPQDLFGERELSDFISAMNKETAVAQCVSLFRARYLGMEELPMKRGDFLHRVRFAIEQFRPTSAQALPVAISELSDKLEQEARPSFDEITARRIVFAAANRLRGTLGTQSVLEGVIRDARSDQFVTEVLNDCTLRRDDAIEDWSKIDTKRLEDCFRQRMGAKYAPGEKASFFPIKAPIDIRPLGRWGLCGTEGQREVHAYLLREFAAQHSNVGSFLMQFFPAERVSPAEDPRTVDPVGTIRQIYFPPEVLTMLLDEYGDSAHSSPEEARAIREFRSRYESRG
jgi:hypothetical protein